MDYKNYTADDLIKDELFQRWVYNPDSGSNAYWNTVLQEHPHLIVQAEEARHFLEAFNFRENSELDARISKLKNRIDMAIDASEPVFDHNPSISITPQGKTTKSFTSIYKIAAAIAVIVLASFTVTNYDNINHWLAGTQQEATPKGLRTLITLNDGTRVWLNADSKLTYPKSFAEAATREVVLEGEAFFDVTEDPTKPFIVKTSTIRVRVLGTSFNLRSYNNDKQIRTTLVKGKVLLESGSSGSDTVTLLPNQQAIFEKQSGKFVLEQNIDTENYTAWKQGKLTFEDQPLHVIIKELERWYDVTIKVEDEESLNCRFSAKINNKTLVEVMELFKASEGIDYVIEGKNVLIKGKLCND